MYGLDPVPQLSLLDSIADAVYIKDLSGTYTYINPAGARMLSRTPAEVIGRNDLDAMDPESAASIRSHDRQILESGEAWSFEDLIDIGGQSKIFRTTKIPLKDAQGRVTHLFGISREFTAIKQAGELVEEFKHRRTSFLDDSQDIVFVLASDGKFLHANLRGQAFFGKNLEQLLGRKISEEFPDRAKLLLPPQTLASGQKLTSLSYEVEHEPTSKTYSVRAYFSEESSSYYLTDTTEKNRTDLQLQDLLRREQEALAAAQAANQQINELAKALPHFIWGYDLITGDGWTNGGWTAYTGASSEDLADEGWIQFLHPDDREKGWQRWQDMVSGNGAPYSEYRIRGTDGIYRWFTTRLIPIFDKETGKVRRYAGITTSIQAAKDHEQQRANFMSLVSHELKTPLTSIRASLEMQKKFIDRGAGSVSQAHQQLIDIGMQSSERLAHLIDDFLTFSRFETGRLNVRPRASNLSSVLSESVSCQNTMLQLQGRSPMVCDFPEQVVGEWDPDRIRQVIDNLIGNAIKYSSPNGNIRVALAVENDSAVLTVRDEGIGIAPEDQQRIFKPFERAVKSTNYGGLGIGLYVSSKIVEQHRGRIDVESQLGGGSCFRVSLPLRQEDPVR